MIITIIFPDDVLAGQTGNKPRIAVANSGNTLIDGVLYQHRLVFDDKPNDLVRFTGRKTIRLKSNDSRYGGGAKGSKYTFYYRALNMIFAICHGITDDSDMMNTAIDDSLAFFNNGF